MADRIFVIPSKEGLIVPDPIHRDRPLPPEGAWKPRSRYWRRRVLCGDVVEVIPPVVAPAVTATPQYVRQMKDEEEE